MGLPAMSPLEAEGVATNDEARVRINSARVRDLAFLIRRYVRTQLSNEDINLLARVLTRMEIEHLSKDITRASIDDALRQEGLSAQKAAQLSSAILSKG